MAWNQFETDRGAMMCGDCGTLVGYRIDQFSGGVVALCAGCYGKRTAPPKPEAPRRSASWGASSDGGASFAPEKGGGTGNAD